MAKENGYVVIIKDATSGIGRMISLALTAGRATPCMLSRFIEECRGLVSNVISGKATSTLQARPASTTKGLSSRNCLSAEQLAASMRDGLIRK